MTRPVGPPPPLRPASRVPPERFQLPVERMREGYYSDKYFTRARDVLIGSGMNPQVTVQVFQKQSAWLGGVDEAIAVLKLCLTDGYSWDDIEVLALHDGDRVEPRVSGEAAHHRWHREDRRQCGGAARCNGAPSDHAAQRAGNRVEPVDRISDGERDEVAPVGHLVMHR